MIKNKKYETNLETATASKLGDRGFAVFYRATVLNDYGMDELAKKLRTPAERRGLEACRQLGEAGRSAWLAEFRSELEDQKPDWSKMNMRIIASSDDQDDDDDNEDSNDDND